MHKPVLLEKVVEYLDPHAGENFVDCTLGEAGHSLAILEKTKPDGRVLGIDLDWESLKRIPANERLILAHGNFKDLKKIVLEKNFTNISGVLFDLGISSWQLEESGRGFSFRKDEPLNMILNSSQVVSAQEILNVWPEESLLEIFQDYGEERFSRKIVQRIVQQRKLAPIKTTFQLVELIKKSIPFSKSRSGKSAYRRGRFDRVAARIFQALKIAVNDETDNLIHGLEQSLEILKKEGRLVIISFHSIEDRIVKRFFKTKEKEGRAKILIKKPITASAAELSVNPRSRSAKLRAAIKI
jgi:16S rRNA (cytosine1402-N4)-methyltransferase